MMPEIKEAMLAVSSLPAVSIVAKVTVTTALGLIGVLLARRSRAAVRHSLLAVTFGVLLVLPVACIIAPPVSITVAAKTRTVSPPLARTVGAIPSVMPRNVGVRVTPSIPRSSPAAVLLAVWIGGAMLFLLPLMMGLWQVRSLRRSGLAWPHGRSAADRLALEAGMRRRVKVLLHETLPGPMTCGVLHPAIVLPVDAQNWKEEDLNRAMVHELEHVKRCDWVSLCLARALCAVYWFHPLVWMAWRRFTLEAERACDDAVLGRSEATAYADQLVGLAQRMAKSPLLAMANRADLGKRVGAVLDSKQRRGRAGVLPVALACAAAAVLVLTLSPLRMVAAPQTAPTMPRFSGTTRLVTTDVWVSDVGGRSINGLRASDFAVSEDGEAQSISVFEFQSPADTATSNYYILGYYTANPNMNREFRKIQVTLKEDPTATLRYRPGYYASRPWGGVDTGAAVDGSAPVLIYAPEPDYSDEARKLKFQGTVTLTVQVEASGQVTNVNVTRRLGFGLDEKAIEAVRRWRFKPGTMGGKSVPMLAEVEVSFRLL